MKFFVTGGAGFIGSQYVRSVLAGVYPETAGARVTVLDKLTYAANMASIPVENPRLEFVRGDICDAGLLAELLPGHDAVVHIAGESHVDRSLLSGSPFVHTNVVGTHTVLEACRKAGVQRVVYVSTEEVYGPAAGGSQTEESLLRPSSPYSATKAAGDLIAGAYWQSHGLPVSITRCCNNYGPFQHIEKMIPLFITSLLDGLCVPLYGDGTAVREWLHVEDHCRAIHLVLTQGRPGEIYNVASSARLTNRELTAKLLTLSGAGWDRVAEVPDRKGHDPGYSIDASKIRAELGFAPRIGLDEGLRRAADWYRGNRQWWEPLRPPAVAPGERAHA